MFSLNKQSKGFTVLEFLVVTGMILILVALVLVGLSAARSRVSDDSRVSQLRNIAVALEQYRDVCRVYPQELIGTATCEILNQDGKSLKDFFSEIDKYEFNQPGSDFVYVPTQSAFDNNNECTGYHMGVRLYSENARLQERAGFQIAQDQTRAVCGFGATDFNSIDPAVDPYYFDIFR